MTAIGVALDVTFDSPDYILAAAKTATNGDADQIVALQPTVTSLQSTTEKLMNSMAVMMASGTTVLPPNADGQTNLLNAEQLAEADATGLFYEEMNEALANEENAQ